MKIEQDSKQDLKRQPPRLRVVQSKVDNLAIGETVCPDCNSREHSKSGTNSQGKKRYRCKNCNRRFLERYEPKTYESADVLSATKLGLRVNHYQRSGDKLNFSNIKQPSYLKSLILKIVQENSGIFKRISFVTRSVLE